MSWELGKRHSLNIAFAECMQSPVSDTTGTPKASKAAFLNSRNAGSGGGH